MSYKFLFSFGGLLVTPLWVLMILFPRWRWTQRLMASPLVALGPAAIYAALVAPNAPRLLENLAGLEEVAEALGTEEGATVGWMHFLTFDLLVGRWIYRDGYERGIHPLLMAPALVLTFMLGPIGYLLYLVLRYGTAQRTQSITGQ